MPILFGPYPNTADTGIILPSTLTKLCSRNDMREPAEFEQWSDARIMDCVCTFLTKEDWRSSIPFLKSILLRMWCFDIDNDLGDELYEQQKDRIYNRLFSTRKREGIELERDWLDYPVSTGTWIPNASAGIRGVLFSFPYSSYSVPISLLW